MHVSVFPVEHVAVITAFPFDFAVTFPSLSTVAMSSSELLHAIVPFIFFNTAFKISVSPGSSCINDSLIAIPSFWFIVPSSSISYTPDFP